MTDLYRVLSDKHRKKDRSEKFLSVTEILNFLKGGGPSKNKNSKIFYDGFG